VVESHAALSEREMPELWQNLRLQGELLAVLATRMLAYTWTRTQELRTMEWGEIDAFHGRRDDGPLPDPAVEWLWEVPESKMKRRKAHLVPLPRQARELLLKLWARSRGSVYVFPAEHRLDRAMSDSTILMLLYRMGYKNRMTGHGFRSVGSTWANERGYTPDAIERQLAHAPEDKVRAAYNKALYLPERRKMLQDWANWLERDAGLDQGRAAPAHGARAELGVRAG